MKRIISIILMAVMLFSLFACGNDTQDVTDFLSFDVTEKDKNKPSDVTSDTIVTEDGITSNVWEDTEYGDSEEYPDTDENTSNGIVTDNGEILPPVTYPEIEKPEENDPSNVVFKQVYGTGYNNDTPFKHSFIELYNVSEKAIQLDNLAISYMTNGDAVYSRFEFPSGAVIAPHSSYLIRCAEAVDELGNPYQSKYEISRIDYYDSTWNVVINNKTVKMAITSKEVRLSAAQDLAASSSVYAYFIATSSTDYSDRNVVAGLSKQKSAYRITNTISSAFKIVDYSTMTPSQIADVRPMYSGGDRNTWLAGFANKVEFSHTSGFYNLAFNLQLTASPGYSIYYTTDGSDPRTNGKKYSTGGIALSLTNSVSTGYLTQRNSVLNGTAKPTKMLLGGHVIKAYATNGFMSSDVVTNSYFIIPNASETYNVPFVSLSITPSEFVSGDRGIYYTVMKNPFAQKERRVAYLEMFEADGKTVSSSYVEIAMNGNGSLGKASKSMRVYFKSDAEPNVVNNPSKLRYDIFKGRAQDGVNEYKRLLLRNSGNDSSYSHLRDGLMQALCTDMNVGTMAYRPSLLFVNGEFWGVYNLRERFDTKYFEEHYGVSEENIVILEAPSPLTTNGSGNEPYVLNEGVSGDEKVFHDLVKYITTKDMASASNYNYVAGKLDIDSFIDFFVCNMYFGNTDWPWNNVKVWRNKSSSDPSGLDTKWRYVVSDMDSGMGLGCDINTNMFDVLNSGTVAGSMMKSLLNNETFKTKFIERFSYACNTKFSYSNTLKVYNEYYNALKPIVSLQFDRWPGDGGSTSRWNTEMSTIKSFLQNRGAKALDHMNAYFGIQPAELNVSLDLNKADLYINGTKITKTGYSSEFAENSQVTVKIVPKSGYTFNGIKTVTASGAEKTYNTQTVTLKISECTTLIGLVSKTNLTVTPTVVAGSRSIFVLDSSGNLYAWGENDISQCGVIVGKTIRKPMLVMSGVLQVEISRGGTEGDTPMTAVLTDTGAVYTIGSNSNGQLGRQGDTTIFAKIDSSVKFKKIAVGFDHLLLLAENGDVYACGNNAYGQLGKTNYKGQITTPTKIASNVKDIAAGRRHTLYITNDSKLYALGDNRWQKISSSANEAITTPFLLASDAKKVYAGQHNSLYISNDDSLYYFGWRSTSTFIQGNSNGKMNKIASNVKEASIMDEHIVFTSNDGSVYGYGLNSYGQITSDKATKTTPTLIANNCVSSSAGTYYTAYITADGKVYVRGSNKSGVIGNGSVSTDYTAPYSPLKVN